METAASSDVPDWKEMLNWGITLPEGHPLRTRYPHRYGPQVLPEAAVPGITDVLNTFHRKVEDIQRRFLRIIAEGLGCHESFFDEMTTNGATLTRAIRYPPMQEAPARWRGHVWAGAHGDINLITALPRVHGARPAGAGRRRVGRRRGARRPGHHQHRHDAGAAHQRRHPHRHPPCRRRARVTPASATAWCSSRTPPRGRCSTRSSACITADNPQRFSGMVSADALDLVLYEINLVETARRVG